MSSFSETLMDHFQAARNRGPMDSPDCIGIAGVHGQGRFIQLFLRISNDRVERMQFESYGCGVTIAVCSVLTELAEGLTRNQCSAIQPADIAAALDGIPSHKMDCAHFAIVALRNAIEQWAPAGECSVVSFQCSGMSRTEGLGTLIFTD